MVFREKRQKGSMLTAEKRGQVWVQFLLQICTGNILSLLWIDDIIKLENEQEKNNMGDI